MKDTILIDNSFKLYEIDDTDLYELDIISNDSGSVFIKIKNVSELIINSTINSNHNVNIVMWNESKVSIKTNEVYDVLDNASLNISYSEINDNDTDRNSLINLKGVNSTAILNSASLVNNKKNYRIKMINEGLRSSARINNHAVVLENGKLMIDAIGKINKGAKKAKSHQTSRALSFSKGQNSTILPELLIDENDVEASHAMSIGRFDENQLYYMMSRGLDMNECVKLISLGYLMPIVNNIDNEELKSTLKDELERKIIDLCMK